MFKKILIANRDESWQSQLLRSQNGCEADVSAKPNCLVHAAHAGEFTPIEASHV